LNKKVINVHFTSLNKLASLHSKLVSVLKALHGCSSTLEVCYWRCAV